jgi:hypothetical protein
MCPINSIQVTDVSLERLVNELDLYEIKTEHCYKLTKYVAKYAKDKMRGRSVYINEYQGPLKQSEIPKFMRRNGNLAVRMPKVNAILPSASSVEI